MTSSRKEGKDVIIFATEDDHKVPSKVSLAEPEPQPGLILADGTINWNCPCLGGMATGPCGVEFRDAFSCFHYSKSDPKGTECFERFRSMQVCMAKYPTLYNNPDHDDDDDLSAITEGVNKDNLLAASSNIDNTINSSNTSDVSTSSKQ